MNGSEESSGISPGMSREQVGDDVHAGADDVGASSTGRPAGRGRHAAPSVETPRGVRRWIVEIVVVLALAGLLAWSVRTFLATPLYVPTPAMSPTLLPGERIIASPIAARLGGVRPGDIIAFTLPPGWPRAEAQPDYAVSRVVATEGQRVTCCDDQGRISVDGIALDVPAASPASPDDSVPFADIADAVGFDVVVGSDRLFVVGDNRGFIADSRAHLDLDSGTIAEGDVLGRIVFVVWPWDRIGIPAG